MKKVRLPAALAFSLAIAALCVSAAPSASIPEDRGAADVVVLLDASQSVLPYFQDVTDSVLSSVVKDFLRFGDTFHLLTFGDSAQPEIAQKMIDERDVKSVLGRLYLLYPLARHTDFLGALGYLGQYLSDLPESRRKIVVVITDGVQNPPPGSPSASLDSDRVAAEIESTCAAIRAKGWDLHLIRLPLTPEAAVAATGETGKKAGAAAPSSKGGAQSAQASPPETTSKSYFDIAAKALGGTVADFSVDGKEDLARRSLALPSVEFPKHLGKKGYSFSFPLKVDNVSETQVGLELEAITLGQDNILSKKSFLTLGPGKSGVMDAQVSLPDSVEPGEKSLDVSLLFANGMRVSPQSGALALTLVRSPLSAFFRGGARIALFIVLLALVLGLAFAILALLKRVPRKAEAPIVAAVLDSAAERDRASRAGATARPAEAAITATAAATPVGRPASPAVAAELVKAAPSPTAKPSLRSALAARAEPDEHETAIARASEELAKASKVESAKAADVLAEAAARKSPAAALAEFAALHAPTAKAKPSAAVSAPAAGVASPMAAAAREGGRVVRPGSIRVELRVEGQNPNIGSRNVHTLHAGMSKTVGGGRSDFLVFLVPVAKRAAEVRFDGEKLAFIPRKADAFPGIEGALEDCLGTDILMVGKGGYPLVLRFAPYERPADKINRLLHCIETPGMASLDFEP